MKLNLKTTGIILASIVTAANAMTVSVQARGTKLGCSMTYLKEFTQSPTIINNTNQTLPVGKIILVKTSLNGGQISTKSYQLTSALLPNKSEVTGFQFQGDSGFKCRASY
jgi:hypothetical protein